MELRITFWEPFCSETIHHSFRRILFFCCILHHFWIEIHSPCKIPCGNTLSLPMFWAFLLRPGNISNPTFPSRFDVFHAQNQTPLGTNFLEMGLGIGCHTGGWSWGPECNNTLGDATLSEITFVILTERSCLAQRLICWKRRREWYLIGIRIDVVSLVWLRPVFWSKATPKAGHPYQMLI